MAVLSGGQVYKAELFADQGRGRPDGLGGQCIWLPNDLTTRQREFDFLAAGAVAHAVALWGQEPSDGRIDYLLELSPDGKRLRELAAASGSRRRPKAVLPSVLQVWPAIEHLAARIQRGPVLHKHVVAAMGLSHDYGRHPFEVNNIRAGMRAVAPRTF